MTTAAYPLRFADDSRHWQHLAPYLVALVLACLYVATLAPSIVGGDSGELTAAALTGGVPHPSGYPVFALLARAFAALPFGTSPAWRVNLLSAASTAVAGGLVCAVVHSWTENLAAGLLAATVFGTNPLVWSHATSAEVFGLNAMFVALAFKLLQRVESSLSLPDVSALLLASGLGMSCHHTFVFAGAPLVVRGLWIARRKLDATGIGVALAFGLLGMTPYLYLLSASASTAAVSWGDETTLSGLVAHVLRRDYGTFSMGRADDQGAFLAGGTFLPTLWLMWGRAFPRALWFGPLLAGTGLVAGIRDRRTRAPASILLFSFVSYGLTFCALANLTTLSPIYGAVIGRFCIESDLLLAMACGLGAGILLRGLPPRSRWSRGVSAGVWAVFVVGVAVHVGQANNRGNEVYRAFVKTAFASLPPDAIVMTNMGDDITGAVFYFHEVEKMRPDVVTLGRAYLGTDWYGARQRRLHPDVYLPDGVYGVRGWHIAKLADGNPRRPVVVLGHLDEWDVSWQKSYRFMPYGLLHTLVAADQVPAYERWASRDRQAIGDYDVAPALRKPDDSWEHGLGQRILEFQVGRAHVAVLYGSEKESVLEPVRYAQSLLEDVIAKSGGDQDLEIAPWPGLRKSATDSGVWKNLGLVYQALSRVDRSYVSQFGVACERFVARADRSDPDLPAARAYLRRMRAAP